eukprot:scaffold287_cov337-Pavlova_lutheri.AAC.113
MDLVLRPFLSTRPTLLPCLDGVCTLAGPVSLEMERGSIHGLRTKSGSHEPTIHFHRSVGVGAHRRRLGRDERRIRAHAVGPGRHGRRGQAGDDGDGGNDADEGQPAHVQRTRGAVLSRMRGQLSQENAGRQRGEVREQVHGEVPETFGEGQHAIRGEWASEGEGECTSPRTWRAARLTPTADVPFCRN